jgi:hypothetical protein
MNNSTSDFFTKLKKDVFLLAMVAIGYFVVFDLIFTIFLGINFLIHHYECKSFATEWLKFSTTLFNGSVLWFVACLVWFLIVEFLGGYIADFFSRIFHRINIPEIKTPKMSRKWFRFWDIVGSVILITVVVLLLGTAVYLSWMMITQDLC